MKDFTLVLLISIFQLIKTILCHKFFHLEQTFCSIILLSHRHLMKYLSSAVNLFAVTALNDILFALLVAKKIYLKDKLSLIA